MTIVQLGFKAYKSKLKPIWCPGCGDFGVVSSIYKALSAIGRPPHEVAFISGIGCSSRIPGYTTAYGFNTVHGRALPIAQGIKLANPELLVLVAGGDGDGFSIGGGHIPHAVRRKPRSHLHRDGQPDLRPDQGAAISHLGLRLQDPDLGTRQPRTAGQSAALRPLLRRRLRRAGDPREHGGHDRGRRRGDPLSRLLVREHPVALRDLRRGSPAGEGAQEVDDGALVDRPRPHEPNGRLRARGQIRRRAAHRRPSTGTQIPPRHTATSSATGRRLSRAGCLASAFSRASSSASTEPS